jgi:transposase
MARSLARSKDIELGGFYSRLAARREVLVANIALAHKLAAWFWRIMVKSTARVEHGLAACEAKVSKVK